MSRRSRAGTAEKPPSVEETVGRLEAEWGPIFFEHFGT